MYPPHLPSPLCNIKNHQRWINIKIILSASFLGFIAGISGASIALGWIWPNYGEGDTWIVSRNVSRGMNLDEIVRKESSDRVLSVYRSHTKLGDLTYLPYKDKIGEAVVISSDGWLAMYTEEDFSLLPVTKMRALSVGGTIYEINRHLFDRRAGVAYFKISAISETGADSVSQFKVASFEDMDLSYQDVFVKTEDGWQYAQAGYKKFITSDTDRLDSAISYRYQLNGNFSGGQVVINNRGRVVGFVTEQNEMLPINALTRIMPGVLSRSKIEYPSFGVYGWYSSVQPVIADGVELSGFVVADVWHKNSQLKRGDVITEINGQIVRDETLWYNIGEKAVVLTVVRNGKVIDISTETVVAGSEIK